jgi:NADP-dependent 3-hydroxy acid dehydrogenase YdfG
MNKIVFITGASSGIGAACAKKFAQAGYDLILNARSKDKLRPLLEELAQSYSVQVYPLIFDVRDRNTAQQAIDTLPERFKAIDVLVNNAGLALGMDKEYEGIEENYDTMIDTNITALLMITRMVVPGMVERGRGHIINIGSVAGDAAYPGGSVYCATKAAVKVLSDGLRMDLVHTPLRVTNVKPGLVETNFSITRFAGDKERADKVLCENQGA